MKRTALFIALLTLLSSPAAFAEGDDEAPTDEGGEVIDPTADAESNPDVPTPPPGFETQLAQRGRERFERSMDAARKAFETAKQRAAQSYVTSLKVAVRGAEKADDQAEIERLQKEIADIEAIFFPERSEEDGKDSGSNDGPALVALFDKMDGGNGSSDKNVDKTASDDEAAADVRALLMKINGGKVLTPSDFECLTKGDIAKMMLRDAESLEERRKYEALQRAFYRKKVTVRFTIDEAEFSGSATYRRATYSTKLGKVSTYYGKVNFYYRVGYYRRLTDRNALFQFKKGQTVTLRGYLKVVDVDQYYRNDESYVNVEVVDWPY